MKRTFLSFLGEDIERVRGLRLLASNPRYDLDFYDESVRVPFDSEDANYIKRKIREKISRASVTVCLISKNTYKSKWIAWELEESERQGNQIIAMALKGVTKAVLPDKIKELGLTFHSWAPQRLGRMVAEL